MNQPGGVDAVCIWADRAAKVARWLRRYRGSFAGAERYKCPQPGNYGACEAMVRVEDLPFEGEFVPAAPSEGFFGDPPPTAPEAFAGDPRWPRRCACGYEFCDADERDVLSDHVYRAADGREWPHRELPPGALHDHWWEVHALVPCGSPPPAKGHYAIQTVPGMPNAVPTVVLPMGGCFELGSQSSGGGWWNVVGDPRQPETLSVTPSIWRKGYWHGFLTAGRMISAGPG